MPRAKVLVVDANESSRAALSKVLAGAGYEVAVAASGSAAVSALEWERPDLVVSHAQVHDMDGYELFVQVRRDPTTMDTPYLLLAGRDRPVALAAREAGVEMTVSGDVPDDTIVHLIGELLERGGRAAPMTIGLVPIATGEPVQPLWAALDAATPALASTLQGSLDVMDLAEVTQAIALGGKTGCLVVSLSAGEGSLVFENGRVVHAVFGDLTGEAAVAAILSVSQREAGATFRFNRADRAQIANGPRTISLSVEQLLLNIAVGIDEADTRPASSADASSMRPAQG